LPGEVRRIYQELQEYSPCKNSNLPPEIIARPTQDLLERWLREMHKMVIGISQDHVGAKWKAFFRDAPLTYSNIDGEYDIFELAREAALNHALNLLPDL